MSRLTIVAVTVAHYCSWLESREARKQSAVMVGHTWPAIELACATVLSVPLQPSWEVMADAMWLAGCPMLVESWRAPEQVPIHSLPGGGYVAFLHSVLRPEDLQ